MIGEKSGNSYANETLGIRAEFSDNWTILDDEQTAQMLGLVADNFSEVDLAEQLRESGSLYDLYAMTVDQSGDNVNVVIEDLGVVNGIIIDEKKYLEIAEDQLETTFAQMGMTDVTTTAFPYTSAWCFSRPATTWAWSRPSRLIRRAWTASWACSLPTRNKTTDIRHQKKTGYPVFFYCYVQPSSGMSYSFPTASKPCGR